jgi:hypothetical protein
VADNPEARAPVVVSEGTSRNFKRRPDFVTDGFQVRYHRVELTAVERSNVLTNEPSWPRLGHNSAHVRPEPVRMRRAASLSMPGRGDGLTGPAGADNVHSFELAGADGSDIVVSLHRRPMLLEHAPAERIALNLPAARQPGAL